MYAVQHFNGPVCNWSSPTDLFKQLISRGYVPMDLKMANFVTHSPQGRIELAPIQLLSCLIYCTCTVHLLQSAWILLSAQTCFAEIKVKNTLSTEQHAFRRNHTSDSLLASLIDDWVSSLDENEQQDILDHSGFWNSLWHIPSWSAQDKVTVQFFSSGVSRRVIRAGGYFFFSGHLKSVVNGIRSANYWWPSRVGPGTIVLHINNTVNIEYSEGTDIACLLLTDFIIRSLEM